LLKLGTNSSGFSPTRRKKAGQKVVKNWTKAGQKVVKNWTKTGQKRAILGYF